MAAPFPNTDEAAVIDKLRLNPDRPELFFRNAKSLADPVSGFEDSDFWSVQALLLMSLYMLAVSKRNASYAYYGMAVRSAFALGLHREEPTSLFQNHQNVARRNMWRTLFILDRFLAACLGRPTAISEADCSERALDPFDPPVAADESPMSSNADTVHLEAVEASVQSCNVIGITLRDVYSKRKISTAVAQAIAVHLDEWPKKLPPSLHWRRIWNGPIHPTEGISILHANLLHCHSVMLLTRPFFLYIINKAGKHDGRKMPRLSPRMDNFGQACAEASQHTIVLAKAALDGHYLPRCNPFVIHCVFAAALIILSNEFAHLYHNPDARESIESSKEILEFCAVQDAQANRVAFIVKAFDQANVERLPTARKLSLSGRHTPTLATLSQNSRLDPIAAFFRKEKETRHHEHFSSAAAHEDRPGMASTLPPSTSIPPMVPSAIQQPSPEGSISLNSNLAVPGIPSGADVLATDTEFDFDSLWNNWGAPPAPRMVLPPTIHPEGDFGQYGMVQPLMPPGNSIINNAGPMFVP
ncbi:fungal-specific transcription factor domain-containing protein [Xylariomycetidae sp. FL2044]|nr:fungal-specific transcription factor domain-containing protein [Xylariomycetidae sp. FL2044]